MTKLGVIGLVMLIGLLLYILAFGETLQTRPSNYTPVDYLSTMCPPGAELTVFRFGSDGDVRWVEIYVEDTPGHQQRAAIASYAPGREGLLTHAEVLLPSGKIVQFESPEALLASQFAEVCQVAAVWLNRS